MAFTASSPTTMIDTMQNVELHVELRAVERHSLQCRAWAELLHALLRYGVASIGRLDERVDCLDSSAAAEKADVG